MFRSRNSSTGLRALIRGAAAATVAASVLVPLLRRRYRIPAPVTGAAAAAGPLAMTVLWPRSKKRDAVLFAQQMWAFTMVHELPYDDPEGLRRRLRSGYPIAADRVLGGGELPTVGLQRRLGSLGRGNLLDRGLTWAHWLWFMEPHVALIWILVRHNERFPRAARQMAATFDIGCAGYFLVPTAPPWWASQQGLTEAPVRRIMVEVGEQTWGRAWPRMYESLGGNPWAAMPSLHFATSVMAAIHLSEAGPVEGAAGWGYALTLGFALVYLGEHYLTDLVAGALLVAAVRRGEPHVEPLVTGFNRVLQRLERVANS
ncbi:MAG: phosphatase PAP2 family protein [Actinomycetota bacterium]